MPQLIKTWRTADGRTFEDEGEAVEWERLERLRTWVKANIWPLDTNEMDMDRFCQIVALRLDTDFAFTPRKGGQL